MTEHVESKQELYKASTNHYLGTLLNVSEQCE